tara:strand:+ start:4256 stop:5071 length:816 start_codon:yes stop_codon:yes gene_type:complete
MHCTTEDCISCFGGTYYVADGNRCSDINGIYGGDCHECDMNGVTNDGGRPSTRRMHHGEVPAHTHPANAHYHQFSTNSPEGGTVGPGGYMASTTQNFTGGTNQGQSNPDSIYQSSPYQSNHPSLIGNTGEAGAHSHPSGIPAIPNSGNGNNTGGGTRNNLRTRGGQFRNKRTGQQVPANQPYHTHNGQAMAGARHINTPHDKYDRFGGNIHAIPNSINNGGGHSVDNWLIDCGGSSVSVDCDTGNDAGFVDGGQWGNTNCVTKDMGCNIVA